MSKKILKRSLALGALMAFVITGSAMAAEVKLGTVDYAVDEKGVHTVNGKVYANTGNYTYVPGQYPTINQDAVKADENHVYLNTDLNGHKLYIVAKNNKPVLMENGTDLANGHGIATGTQWGQRVINIYDSSADKTGDLEIVASGSGIYGVGDINVDELIINAQGNAIECSIDAGAQYDETLEIMANTIVLTSHSGNGIQANSSVKIGKSETERVGNLTINAADRPLRLAYGDKLDIYADTLNITKAKSEIKVDNAGNENGTGTSTMTIFANSGEIESDIIAGTDSSKGAVNLTFGSNVNWIGAISTGANASVGALDLSGTWNLTEASSLTNATFNAGSTLVIEGADYENADGKNEAYALNGVGENAILTVENGAKLNVTGIKETTYNVATGFAEIKGENYWTVGNMADLNNNLMEGKWLQDEDKNLQLQIAAKEADTLVEELGVSETTGEFLNTLVKDAGEVEDSVTAGTAEAKLVGLANAAAQSKNPVVVAKAAEALQKMAEAGGNSATAANVVNNVTNVTGQRMSFTSGNNGNKGGHGVGLLEEGSGAAIWAQYVHGKDSVEDMPSEAGASSYEGQYNGIVMGVDFKKVGKFQSGIAFNYGEGDTNSVNTTSPTRSDYDFWGVGYYGNIRNADSNVIFDIGYAKTDSDVTSNVLGTTFEASPETTTWTAGVKVEKLYQNNNVQIVPYTGLRYMSIDPDDYSTKCGALSYNLERQDIWMLPVGVSIKQEIVNPNGWVVTPKVDLSYIWAFGDTDSSMETNTVFGSDNRPIGYDVMDDGSWMGLVGVEAAMDDWTFGVSYSYQKGDHSESKKWYVDAKYSF